MHVFLMILVGVPIILVVCWVFAELDGSHDYIPGSGQRHKTARRPESRSIPQDVKIQVTLRDGGHCRHCGSTDRLEFDHIRPWSWGGGNDASNVQLLCRKCNMRKGARYTG